MRNALVMPIGIVDEAVLRSLAGDVLRDSVVKALVAAVVEALAPPAVASNVEALRADLRKVDQRIANLTAAIEDGGAPAPLVTQLQARQTEREGLLAAIAAGEAVGSVAKDRAKVERRVLEQVARWRALLTKHVEDGRQLLREILEGPLRFTPEGRAYRFDTDVATGKLVAGLCVPLVASPTGHAGEWTSKIKTDTRVA